MRGNKRIAVLMIAALTTASMLSACSQKGGGDSAGTTQAAPKQAPADVSFPLKQQVTLNIFADRDVQVTKDYNNLQMFKDLEKSSNVHINWSYGSSQDINEKKNLIFASNDLPDAFYGRGILTTDDIVKYGTQGTLIPLEGLIDKYAPNLQAAFKKQPELKKIITAPDGHIYTLPFAQTLQDQRFPSTMYINKKWLDKLNLKMPTTTDELYQVLIAFRDGDPNGNGKHDEIPLSFLDMRDNTYSPLGLAGAFGKSFGNFNNNFWTVDNGKVTFAPAVPENRDFMVYLNKLYSENLIDKEILTQSQQVLMSKMRSKPSLIGVCFIYSDLATMGSTNTDYVPLPPLKGPGGATGWTQVDNGYSPSAFAITKVDKYPELTMKWIDQSFDPLISFQMVFGAIGTSWKEESTGQYKYTEIPAPSNMNPIVFRGLTSPAPGAVAIVLPDDVNAVPLQATKIKEALNKIYEPVAPKEWYPYQFLVTPQDGEIINKWATDVTNKNAYMDQEMAKIITRPDPVGEWSRMMEQLKKYNIDKVTEAAQKYYDRIRK